MNDTWCNNCAKMGHTFNQCKIPITSFGCIVFRNNKKTNCKEYLMICRRYSIAYLEFIRGKYNIEDKESIKLLFQQMTNSEKEIITIGDFNKIWNITWCENTTKDKNMLLIFTHSADKYQKLFDNKIIEEFATNDGLWVQPEWGFPKGRREYKETDYNSAIREFQEETGINNQLLRQIKNIIPVEENFMGSNYKTYKHKYYLMYMNFEDTLCETNFQKSEVSCISWKSIDQCIESIRPYNIEKKTLIKNIDELLNSFIII